MSDPSIFMKCLATFPDPANDLTNMLQCISDENENLSTAIVNAGPLYVCLAGALVFFMQTGFAMLCAGSIRTKNVRNVILWNLLDSAGGGLAFWAVGWAFMFGGDDATDATKTFIGNTQFFVSTASGIVPLGMWFYQFTFACAPSSIVAGTIAERASMKSYLMYSVFLVAFVYPVVGHAVWSYNGFLSITNLDPLFGSGVIDFAGSGVVHMTGGVAALAGGLVLGPRTGRFYALDGTPHDVPKDFPPHNVALQFLGTFFLWFGWFGFNSGSAFTTPASPSDQVYLVQLAIINTTLAACAGGIGAMFSTTLLDWYTLGVPMYDTTFTMNGLLTGLVAITSGAGTVEPWCAVIIGIVSGWVYIAGSKTLVYFRIDDAVDAVPVHMFGGAWGLLATGLFTSPRLVALAYNRTHAGWFYEWGRGSANFSLCGAQIIAIIFITAWSFTLMGSFFYLLNVLGWFRIDPIEEEVGLDHSRHKGAAYDTTTATNETVEQYLADRQKSLHGKMKEIDAELRETADVDVSDP